MFILESTYDGVGTLIETQYQMTNSEAGAYGQAAVLTAGRLTKAGATVTPQFILIKATTAGTNVATECIRIRNDQVWLADVSGTATISAINPGIKTATISTDGLTINSDLLATGLAEVVSKDTAKNKVRVRFNL